MNLTKKKNSYKFYLDLFLSTFYLSAFTFGGGYVIVPLMRQKFVKQLNWIEEEEMLNLIAIAQSAPGPIAVNTSILVGYKLAGLLGAFITILGTVLPPLITLSVISLFYLAFKQSPIINAILKGMSAGVAAVVVNAVISMGSGMVKNRSNFSSLIMVLAFIAIFLFEIDVKVIILVCGFVGLVFFHLVSL
jgi:chromate transporter